MASRTRSSSRPPHRRALAIVLPAAALVLAACVAAAAAPARAPFVACLVTDAQSTSLSGQSFGSQALEGLDATKQFGVRVRELRSSGPADDVVRLRTCVLDGADVTIAVGSLMGNALNAVAATFPTRTFLAVDVDVRTLAGRPSNVAGLVFRAEEAGYLVGYAAGLWAKAEGAHTVGSVGGLRIPPVDAYIAGFQAGAKRALPGIRTLNDYAQSVTDEAVCRRLALSQLDDGSVVELQVAGRCGLGVLSAAHLKGAFAIGVDGNQGHGRPWVMTSAVKHVAAAVRAAVMAAKQGTLATGANSVFGAQRDGIGYTAWSPLVPASIRAAVARQARLLRAGALPDIPATIH